MSLISNFYCFAFSTTAFLLSLLFQSRSQVVLGKVKSVELVLRIRILKWSSEDFHPLRCAVRLGDGGEDLSWVETLAVVFSCQLQSGPSIAVRLMVKSSRWVPREEARVPRM